MGVWDAAFQASPSGAKALGVLDDEQRAIKSRLIERVQKEHTFGLTTSDQTDQFTHKAGSAKAYISATAPTARPDGNLFTQSDEGRIWIKHQYTGSPSTSQPIGIYYLHWDTDTSTYEWLKDPLAEPIGALSFYAGTFTNPSGLDPYRSGTKPGWVLANGASVVVGLPNPAGWVNVPNYTGKYLKTGTTAGATGGNASFTLTVANLPPHTHVLDTGGNATASSASAGNHSHNIDANNDGFGGSNSKRLNFGSRQSRNDQSTDAAGAHTHTITLGGETEDNDGSVTMTSTAVNLDPEYFEMVIIVRMY